MVIYNWLLLLKDLFYYQKMRQTAKRGNEVIIKRDAYLNKLIERQNNGMVKVITGIRRCGKSFLLFKQYKEYLLNNGVNADHIIEIALEGIDVDELRNPKVCYSYIKEKIIDTRVFNSRMKQLKF